MGCVSCTNCMGYDPADGKFGPILDPDGAVVFGEDESYIGLSNEVPGRLLDHRPTDPTYPDCPNRIHKDDNGLLWADPPARFGDIQFSLSLFPGLNLNNQTVTNTNAASTVFTSPPCYKMFWQFSIIRTIQVSTTVTNFEFHDYINGAQYPPSKTWINMDSENTDWELSSTIMFTAEIDYNIAANLNLGYQIISYGATSLYSVHYQVKGIGISAPEC